MIFRKDLPMGYAYHQENAADRSRLMLLVNPETQELLINLSSEPNELVHLSVTYPLTVTEARSLRDYLTSVLNE